MAVTAERAKSRNADFADFLSVIIRLIRLIRVRLVEAMADHITILISGAPGTGKSTLCAHAPYFFSIALGRNGGAQLA